MLESQYQNQWPKWFKGKEIALAMGMQVAIARLGSFAPLAFGAYFA
jgi:hypothetical protein